MGYDGIDFHNLIDWELTTIVQPIEQLGKLAATKVIEVIQKKKIDKRYILEVSLREGSTT